MKETERRGLYSYGESRKLRWYGEEDAWRIVSEIAEFPSQHPWRSASQSFHPEASEEKEDKERKSFANSDTNVYSTHFQ